ncbi:hypothetical protein WMY93_008272 [Mugilogobius chulae]|uniref:UDP-glucuronosyltransferase n=1 Tax=Mugilogobius chulae TaxID=88201 RepID=A0AAW0PKG6_9GOBI
MGNTSWIDLKGSYFIISVFLVCFAPACDGGNILVCPLDGSHFTNMKVLLEELHSHGHKLTLMRSNHSWYIEEQSHLYSTIHIPSKFDLKFFGVFLEKQLQAQIEGLASLLFFAPEFISLFKNIHQMWQDDIHYVFNNKTLLKELKDAKYDLMLTDSGGTLGLILAKYLNLPLVLNARWFNALDSHFVFAPSPVSYIPVTGSGFTDKMDFFQRVQNVIHLSFALAHEYLVIPGYNALCEKYVQDGCDIASIMQDADIWLFRSDFVFDFPRPTMPNVVYIGGFQCKPAQPLPAELEDFVQSAGEHGVIIMTMGSLSTDYPVHSLMK